MNELASSKQDTRRCRLIVLALVVATLAIYGQVWRYDFVNFDDYSFVDDPHVASGLSLKNVRWAFTTLDLGFWQPLTWISLMADAQIYGRYAGGYHLTNVLLHLASGILLFLAMRKMTGDDWKSGFVAAFFLIHPLHVESVAWVAERKDTLSTFFGILAILAYAHYAMEHRPRYYGFALAALLGSLMSKSMLVTLPCVLLLLDYWPLRRYAPAAPGSESDEVGGKPVPDAGAAPLLVRSWFWLVLEKVPFFALSFGSSLLTILAQGSGENIADLHELALRHRLANAVVAYVKYLWQTIWPENLAVYYPHPGTSLPTFAVVSAALILAVFTVACLWELKRRPYLIVGWLWFLGTLIPIIGVVQAGEQQMANRFIYFPQIGLSICIAWLVPSLVPAGPWRRYVLPVAAVSLLVAYSAVAWVQTTYWRNSVTLFTHTLAVVESARAHSQLGLAYSDEGQTAEAIEHYERALTLDPNDVVTHYNLGNVLAGLDQSAEAMAHFRRALEIYPGSADAHYNIANELLAHERYEEAIEHYRETIRIDPEYAEAYNNLGNAYLQIGDSSAAIDQFREAIRIDPDYALPHFNLGGAFLKLGQYAQASEHYAQAVSIDPQFWQAYLYLGKAYLAQGNRQLAIESLERAVELEPDSAEAQRLLESARQH